MSAKSNTNVILGLTIALTKRYLRNRVALFFTVVFPLIFLVIFGGIFGGNSNPEFKVSLYNKSKTDYSKEFEKIIRKSDIFNVSPAMSPDLAKDHLSEGKLDAIIRLPKDFGNLNQDGLPSGTVELIYDEGDTQLSATLQSVMQGVLDGTNAQFIKITPPLTLRAHPIQTANLSSFDYTLSGLLGFSILGLGIFSMANGFTSDKKTGALRRIQVAPVTKTQFIIATALNRIIIGFLAVAMLFAVALIFFDFNMRGSYLLLAFFTLISTVCMFGFGMAIAGWAKDDIQAAPLANIISFPMLFLSGSFFPRFLMPEWIQNVSYYLPLTPIIDGLRRITTEGAGLFDLGTEFLVIAIWSIVIYAVASMVFRWE